MPPPGMFVDPIHDRVRCPEEMHAASGSGGRWSASETELVLQAIKTRVAAGHQGVGKWKEILKLCGGGIAKGG